MYDKNIADTLEPRQASEMVGPAVVPAVEKLRRELPVSIIPRKYFGVYLKSTPAPNVTCSYMPDLKNNVYLPPSTKYSIIVWNKSAFAR